MSKLNLSRKYSLAILLIPLFFPISIVAQINGNFLNESQLGNIPNRNPSDLLSNYTRLNLNYEFKNLTFRSLSEIFVSQNPKTSYFFPSQVSLNYKNNNVEIKLGNTYETIGRGNILRSYEIPGSILEDKIFRSRSYFYKDILGGSIKYSTKNFNVKLIAGKPLDNLIPPTEKIINRRTESILAVNPEFKIKNVRYGSGLMSYTNPTDKLKFYLTNYVSYGFGTNSIYLELSNNLNQTNSYALYGGLNLNKGNFGGSIEIKDYKNFLIGTGINQPPALVREHIYRVLNRSTHVLLPDNERGFQIEVFYSKDKNMLTLNHTIAENEFVKKFLFSESFFEYQHNFENGNTFKTFADIAQDDFKGEKNRFSFGMQQDFMIKKKKFKAELELQTFSRSNTQITNQVYGLSLVPIKNLTISPLLEISNDPFLESKNNLYFGVYSRYIMKSNFTFQSFMGERRGGPACNAGICYEVLDFRGFELKSIFRI